jgi:hypothetical protein
MIINKGKLKIKLLPCLTKFIPLRPSKSVSYMNSESIRPRGRPRNRWQDELREDGRIMDEEWQEKVYNREKWKKPLRTARNRCILHTPTELMNELKSECIL